MGTKSNPGSFNCYAAALPDETIFTTLARDPAMPNTIRFWIGERARLGKNVEQEDIDRLAEAALVAEDAEDWREKHLDPFGDGIPAWKMPRPEPGIEIEERPIRVDTASQYERARLDPLYTLMPKIIVGLRQVAQDMIGRGNRDVPVDSDEHGFDLEAFPQYADRINGFAQEIADAVGPGDFTVDFNGFNQDAPENPAEVLRTVAVEIGRTTGREVDHDAFDRAAEQLDQPAESDMVDLAAVGVEVPPHRFSYFFKGERYAYARGLEVNPTHLPRALDEMTKDGWYLLAIFGATDSASVGFIFERRQDPPGTVRFGQSGGQIIEHLRDHVEQAKLLLQPAEDHAWVMRQLGDAYAPDCQIAMSMMAAIERGRILVQTDLPVASVEAMPRFLSGLSPKCRVEVMLTLMHDKGQACARYSASVLAAEHVETTSDGAWILDGLPDDKLGRIAARLETAYRDECVAENGGCTGYGRQQEP